MLDGALGHALLQGGGKVLEDDDGFGAAVFQLVLQLARGVQRVHVYHDKARTKDACHHHRVLRHIGQHDRHTVALLQAQALQVGPKSLGQAVGLLVADGLAQEAVRQRFGILFKRTVDQLHQRFVLGDIDVGRHAGGVGIEPRTSGHRNPPE